MESCNGRKKAVVEVMMNEIIGVSKITQRKEYFDGTIKNPPTAIAVRIKLKPM
jgi:hypothetical protein